MLDDFKDGQPIAYQILKKSIKEDKISHAYLFELNGNIDGYNFAKAFAKSILCPKKNTSFIDCGNCTQCRNIDKNCFVEMKVIEAEGQWIKKEQLYELQQEFSYKSIASKYKVYIIKDCEKLNSASANTLLKFLEEPEENIVAILLTNNLYQVISTITSRCQIITLKGQKVENNRLDNIKKYTSIKEDIEEEKMNLLLDTVEKFTYLLETTKNQAIVFSKKYWHDIIEGKEMSILGYELIFLYYKDVLNSMLKKETIIFSNNDKMKKVISLNTIESINRKLVLILDLKEKIKYNANLNLLLDRLIIEMAGVENG